MIRTRQWGPMLARTLRAAARRRLSPVDDAFKGAQWSVKAFVDVEARELEALRDREGTLGDDEIAELYKRSHLRPPGPEELAQVREDLQRTLLKCRALREHAAGEGPPGASGAPAPERTPLREDAVTEGGEAEAILGHSSHTEGGAFKVPRLV